MGRKETTRWGHSPIEMDGIVYINILLATVFESIWWWWNVIDKSDKKKKTKKPKTLYSS